MHIIQLQNHMVCICAATLYARNPDHVLSAFDEAVINSAEGFSQTNTFSDTQLEIEVPKGFFL